MTLTEFEARWRKEIRRARRASLFARIWIDLIVIVGALSCALCVIVGIQSFQPNPKIPAGVATALGELDIVLGALNAFLIYCVLFGVRRFVMRRESLERDKDHFVELSADSVELLRGILDPLVAKVGLRDRKFLFIRPRKSELMSPAVIEKRDGTVVLIAPLDFLSVAENQPDMAAAMLAHELGHVMQEDTKLWHFVSGFAEEVVKFFLPFNLACAIITIGMGFAVAASRNLDSTGLSFLVYACVTGVAPLVSLAFFYERFRRFRRKSEELADLAAWIIVGSSDDSLERCFRLPEPKPARGAKALQPADRLLGFGFLGEPVAGRWSAKIHPSRKQRLNQIAHYRRLLEGKGRSLRLTSYWTAIEKLGAFGLPSLALITFPVLQAAKAAAKETMCLSSVKQLSLAALMYSTDHDDLLPIASPSGPEGSRNWAELLAPDLNGRTPYTCPVVAQPKAGTLIQTNYLYNGILAGLKPSDPASTILLHEGSVIGDPGEAPSRDSHDPTKGVHFNSSTFDVNHVKANVAFADGHAKSMPKGELTYKMFGAAKDVPIETDPDAADRAYKQDPQPLDSEFAQPPKPPTPSAG